MPSSHFSYVVLLSRLGNAQFIRRRTSCLVCTMFQLNHQSLFVLKISLFLKEHFDLVMYNRQDFFKIIENYINDT